MHDLKNPSSLPGSINSWKLKILNVYFRVNSCFFNNIIFVFVVKLHYIALDKLLEQLYLDPPLFLIKLDWNSATSPLPQQPQWIVEAHRKWIVDHKSTTLRHKMDTIRLVVYDCHSGACIIVWTQHISCLWFHYECWKTYLHTCTLNHIHLDDIRMRQLYRVDNS